MDSVLKRIVAFVIDILIVTSVVTIVTDWTNIDPYKDEYQSAYDEYLEVVENYEDMDESEYTDTIIALNYDLYKYRVVSSSISVLCLVLYFGVLQLVMNGQTLGKKIMNLQVVSNKDKKLNFGNYLLRVIILNNIVFTILSLIAVYIWSGEAFYYVTYGISLVQSTVYMLNVLFMVLRRDNRALHDIVAGTKVIDLKPMMVSEETETDTKAIEEPKETKGTKSKIKEKVEKKENKENSKKKK